MSLAESVDGGNPGVFRFRIDTGDIEKSAQADLRPERVANTSHQLLMILARDGSNVDLEFGRIGHRIDVEATLHHADAQSRRTHQRMRRHVERKVLECQGGPRNLVDGIYAVLGHGAMRSFAGRRRTEPERAFVAEQRSVSRWFTNQQRFRGTEK